MLTTAAEWEGLARQLGELDSTEGVDLAGTERLLGRVARIVGTLAEVELRSILGHDSGRWYIEHPELFGVWKLTHMGV